MTAEPHPDCPVHHGMFDVVPCLWCRFLRFEEEVKKRVSRLELGDEDVEVPDEVYGY